LSRTAARKTIDSELLIKRLEEQGVEVRSKTRALISEEAPEAYKNVDDVVRLTEDAGLARPVARLRPLGVIKG
jgi:tRNA-splicing ligase RtcB